MPRYQQIARQLKNAIEKGELKPGTRLPSSRTWAQELGVSRSTVENAYAELVAQGWLARRGHLQQTEHSLFTGKLINNLLYPVQAFFQMLG